MLRRGGGLLRWKRRKGVSRINGVDQALGSRFEKRSCSLSCEGLRCCVGVVTRLVTGLPGCLDAWVLGWMLQDDDANYQGRWIRGRRRSKAGEDVSWNVIHGGQSRIVVSSDPDRRMRRIVELETWMMLTKQASCHSLPYVD